MRTRPSKVIDRQRQFEMNAEKQTNVQLYERPMNI